MVDVERCAPRPAVGAGAGELLEQVLPDLVAEQRPLLVLDTCDLGVLEALGVEADELEQSGIDQSEATEQRHGRDRRVHPVLDARRQPALAAPAVRQARGSVAEVGASAPAPVGGTLGEAVVIVSQSVAVNISIYLDGAAPCTSSMLAGFEPLRAPIPVGPTTFRIRLRLGSTQAVPLRLELDRSPRRSHSHPGACERSQAPPV